LKIGLLLAIEADAVFSYYPKYEEMECPCGYRLYHVVKDTGDIYILQVGMGEIAASAGTQYLITRFQVDAVCNFGVVGGLSESMSTSKICIVDRVVHYKYDCSEFMPLKIGQVADHDSVYLPTTPSLVEKAQAILPELPRVICCSGDKFVGTAEEKASIRERFAGDICDMESAGIVLTCEANNTPCLLLKAVSDSLSGGAGEFYENLLSAAYDCLVIADRVFSKIF